MPFPLPLPLSLSLSLLLSLSLSLSLSLLLSLPLALALGLPLALPVRGCRARGGGRPRWMGTNEMSLLSSSASSPWALRSLMKPLTTGGAEASESSKLRSVRSPELATEPVMAMTRSGLAPPLPPLPPLLSESSDRDEALIAARGIVTGEPAT